MNARTISGAAITVVCLAALIWLASLLGVLPGGLGGDSRLTPAPDKDQGPAYNLSAQTSAQPGLPATAAPTGQQAPAAPASAANSSGNSTAAPAQAAQPEQPPAQHYTTDNRVNVRSGPGTQYGVAGQVAPGAVVTLTKNPGGKWIEIQGDNVSGWVYKPLFKKTDK